MVEKSTSKSKALAAVQHFVETEKRIPQLPQILLRVEATLDNPGAGGALLAKVILEDPALTAQVLKVANSTFYNPLGSKVNTVSRAIVVLGFDNIRRLVLGLSVSRMLTLVPRWSVYRTLWRHSLAVGLLARDLARLKDVADTEVVFVAGLLHDVGKFILGHLHGREYAEILERSFREPDFDLCRAENELFFCDHQSAGVVLARSWGLPVELVQIISRHLPGADWSFFKETPFGQGAFVVLANQMAHLLEWQGDKDNVRDTQASFREKERVILAQAQAFLSVNEEGFRELLRHLGDEISATAATLDIALDGLRLDDAVDGNSGPEDFSLKRHVDRSALYELSLKISEQTLVERGFSGYIEATAGHVFEALGLEAFVVYLPGSKGRGLAPGFCYGGGALARVLAGRALPPGQDDIVNQVFSSNRMLAKGKPPEGALQARQMAEFWVPGRILAFPLTLREESRSLGVLLVLRNRKTVAFNSAEERILELYSSFLALRLGPAGRVA
ncbi:MAG: HDOD domain-containing protein [Deltaproteobacteria bacterium]|nr:HDOD domain-containing protein [Deltaproteobacteria bacterium]